jgi:predicted MPP superfamily phosphohydrolase
LFSTDQFESVHARRRLEIEIDLEARIATRRLPDWVYHGVKSPAVIRFCLQAAGLWRRARRNALDIHIVEHELPLPNLDRAFDGFTLLHLTDLHIDFTDGGLPAVLERVRGLAYDIVVMTGDFRAKTYGPIDAALDGMRALCQQLRAPMYAVLGNHDSIRMVAPLQAMGLRVLINESVELHRGAAALTLGGIDDAHFFGLDDVDAAGRARRPHVPSVLLSHSPEAYRDAERVGFDAMLCGHTHGGQICLPGGLPMALDARMPRRFGRGRWRHGKMLGYTSAGVGTSIVEARLNCPPEITLHRLRSLSPRDAVG